MSMDSIVADTDRLYAKYEVLGSYLDNGIKKAKLNIGGYHFWFHFDDIDVENIDNDWFTKITSIEKLEFYFNIIDIIANNPDITNLELLANITKGSIDDNKLFCKPCPGFKGIEQIAYIKYHFDHHIKTFDEYSKHRASCDVSCTSKYDVFMWLLGGMEIKVKTLDAFKGEQWIKNANEKCKNRIAKMIDYGKYGLIRTGKEKYTMETKAYLYES